MTRQRGQSIPLDFRCRDGFQCKEPPVEGDRLQAVRCLCERSMSVDNYDCVPRRAAPPRPGGCRAVPSPSSPTRPPSGAARARPRAAKKGDRRYPLQSDHISRIQPTSKSMNIIAKRENRPRRIVKFHKTRHIQLRHGRSTIPKGEGEAYYHWCFSDLETARSSSNNLVEQSYKHNRSKRDNARAGWRRNTA